MRDGTYSIHYLIRKITTSCFSIMASIYSSKDLNGDFFLFYIHILSINACSDSVVVCTFDPCALDRIILLCNFTMVWVADRQVSAMLHATLVVS